MRPLPVSLLAAPALLLAACAANKPYVKHMSAPAEGRSLAYRWVDVMLEAAARDVERVGAEPTVLSRQMAIPMMAMYEAWTAYDDVAVGPYLQGALRVPASERSEAAEREALSYAMYAACVDQYPHHEAYLTEALEDFGYTSPVAAPAPGTPAHVGLETARVILAARHSDGANQLGDHPRSSGEPYADTTGYTPVNTPTEIVDPDRWQPIPFDDGMGGEVVVPFLTPHWHLVEPFGLESADQFRPGPPPLVGSARLKAEVDECIAMNASLDPDQKALVEFMRDGPRSTGQSGHWMRFAQDVSVRDGLGLDGDVKLFFAVAVTAMDAFIASWDAKRFYDSSRPWTLVRHLYEGQEVRGWGGPGKGTVTLMGDDWHPYSPSTFITPPFPGYVSGHSTVSAACAKMLELFTGSDRFGVLEERVAGELTEEGAPCEEMQQVDGRFTMPDGETLTCDVAIPMETFSQAAELAGISRVLGGYHIQADNVAGLELGRDVAAFLHPRLQGYFRGELP